VTTETVDWDSFLPQEETVSKPDVRERREPSWFDFDPLERRYIKLKKDDAAARLFLSGKGVKIGVPKNAKSPELKGYTWEIHDDLLNAIERLEPPRDVSGELAMIAALLEKKGYIKDEIQDQYQALATVHGIGTTRTMSVMRKFADEAPDVTPEGLISGMQILELVTGKEVADTVKTFLEPPPAELVQQCNEAIQALHEKSEGQPITEEPAQPDTAQADIKPESAPEPQASEKKGKGKGGKKPKEDNSEKILALALRPIDTAVYEHPWNKKIQRTYSEVMYNWARIKAKQWFLNLQLAARKAELDAELKKWEGTWLGIVQHSVIEQFESQRFTKVDEETGETETQFKPATVKTEFGTWYRQPEGGPHLEDPHKWQHFLARMDGGETALKELDEMASRLNEVQSNAFFEVFNNWQLIVSQADAKRLLELGISLPGWIIKPGDDIGKPTCRFDAPKKEVAEPYLMRVSEVDDAEVTEDENAG
jgi:hypothetical protein